MGKSTDQVIHDMLSPVGKMVYYNESHLVIVEDYESNVALIEEFVKRLWAMPTQVFIDAKVVEVELDAGDALGLQWTAVLAPAILQLNSTTGMYGPRSFQAGRTPPRPRPWGSRTSTWRA